MIGVGMALLDQDLVALPDSVWIGPSVEIECADRLSFQRLQRPFVIDGARARPARLAAPRIGVVAGTAAADRTDFRCRRRLSTEASRPSRSAGGRSALPSDSGRSHCRRGRRNSCSPCCSGAHDRGRSGNIRPLRCVRQVRGTARLRRSRPTGKSARRQPAPGLALRLDTDRIEKVRARLHDITILGCFGRQNKN